MKPKPKEVAALTQSHFHIAPRAIRELPTNGPDRHWNWKVAVGKRAYLVRIENPLAVRQRLTHLEDEIKIVRFFGSHGLSPRLEAVGTHRGRRFMIEEWIAGRELPRSGALTDRALAQVVAFLGAVNAVPVTFAARRVVRWKEDFLDAAARTRVIEDRLKAGRTVSEFRPLIRAIESALREGLSHLEGVVGELPEQAVRTPRFVYRDITPQNLLIAKGRCIAVDWEWHSVGIADPSFSLVVLLRRFQIGPRRREALIRRCARNWKMPELPELVRARELERVLGEATWPFGWVARRAEFKLPGLQKEMRGAMRTARASIAELRRILASSGLGR